MQMYTGGKLCLSRPTHFVCNQCVQDSLFVQKFDTVRQQKRTTIKVHLLPLDHEMSTVIHRITHTPCPIARVTLATGNRRCRNVRISEGSWGTSIS